VLRSPERAVGTGEALVRAAEQQDRELVARREHELEVGDRLVCPRGIRSGKLRPGWVFAGEQLRQSKAAEVLRQPGLDHRGFVELLYRGGHVMAGADLKEAG
jgi:hypothetical protein